MPNVIGKLTIPALVARKGGERIAMLTAYDAQMARLLDDAGAEILLVGDSLGMVVLGYETTLPVTMEEMLHHTRAVSRAARRAIVVGDMPYLSYHVSRDEAVRNAGRFVKEGGANAVKIEGGAKRVGLVEAMLDAEIPVMGHLGLTPQSFHKMGGFRVQGRDADAGREILADARALDRAGIFALVLEGIPAELAREVTAAVSVPTIGIGAGPGCDGQVLVINDLLGMTDAPSARFVRRYAQLGKEIGNAVTQFVADVKNGTFPSAEESYHRPATAESAAVHVRPITAATVPPSSAD